MGYKVILIENDVKMSIKLNNIIINKEGHEFTREEMDTPNKIIAQVLKRL